VVAVSGGADSVALLHLLDAVTAKRGPELVVAHANHQLRGRDSDADETFVRLLAARLGHRFTSARLDVRGEAKRSRESVEMAARRLRHGFLAKAAQEAGASTIALAHHADDQAELFFLRLLRGAGGEGLGGMGWRSPSPADPRRTLIRPLLDLSKTDLLIHAATHRWEFREDASNADRDILRNRVRHELLPLLARGFTPAIRDVVGRAAELVGAEADFVRLAAERWLKSRRRAAFGRLHPAVQRAVIRSQLWRLGQAGDFELTERLRLGTEAVSVRHGDPLCRGEDGQIASVASAGTRTFKGGTHAIEAIQGSGTASFGGVELSWETKPTQEPQGAPSAPGQESFDADRVGPRVTLRHWRPGDRFQPLGFPKPTKLQDLFVNRKISAARRRELIVAETDIGELCWVEGLPPGEPFKLTAATRRRWVLRWCR
jgi:tRNA(Ile)-lysidine synthase